MLQRKIFFTFLFWVIGFICSYADNYTSQQILFRNDIKQFLKEEGYSPSINNETGDINFKMEGTNYVVGLDKGNDGPYLVTLSATFGMGTLSVTDKARLYEVENTVNSNFRCVKVSYIEFEGNNIIIFAIESFCHNSEDFKYALSKYLGLIKNAVSKFTSLYNEHSSGKHTEVRGSISRQYGNKIFVNGSISETTYHKWFITSIELNSYNTVVNKTVEPKIKDTYVMATKDEYIEDCDTGTRYYIISSSLGIEPQKTVLYSTKAKHFYDTFPALPSYVKRINIWSGSDYYVKNLKIR